MLAGQLGTVALDSAQQAVTQFTASHRDLLERMSKQLDSIFTAQVGSIDLTDETQLTAARLRLFDSLYFSQIYERREHIVEADHETYKWILEPNSRGEQRWDDFVSWLKASPSSRRVYWVSGKIGAGKSTLLHYIDGNLDLFQHSLPWTEKAAVVRASYFFWNAGIKLQKSMIGLLRTLLIQLLVQTPSLVATVLSPKKWRSALNDGKHLIEWTEIELKNCLWKYLIHIEEGKKKILLIDGLDEIDGNDEARENLLDFLTTLAAYENVKVCVSSRRWNIFQDAFEDCPKLKLEDLTYDDICAYICNQLEGNRRFQRLIQHEPTAVDELVEDLIAKAAGVFLWVRMVVKQILNGLRDGDNIRALRQRVEEIPADLDDYYMRLMESIEPRNRKEASELFQIALYEERSFTSLQANSLVDFMFIEEGKPDFALAPSYNFSQFNFANRNAVMFRLESTI